MDVVRDVHVGTASTTGKRESLTWDSQVQDLRARHETAATGTLPSAICALNSSTYGTRTGCQIGFNQTGSPIMTASSAGF